MIAGLEAGTDDYVTKPLVAGVLAAPIRALLGREVEPDPDEPEPVPTVRGSGYRTGS